MSACASLEGISDLYEVPELVDVPFHTQSDFDCGPAALATILNAEGVAVSPAELIDVVYIERLKGSLQVELVGATRRYGLLPIPIPPDPQSLLTEISSGRPVLVLQNLRFARAPAWHYAVVVGYSAERGRFVLRSGEEERRMERASRFMRSWRLADNWGFVAVTPGEIPSSATPDTYMRALVGSVRQLDVSDSERAYATALDRWPNDSLVLFLAASWEQSRANLALAARLYRRLLALEPEHAAGRNNLANILLDQGCKDEALREARAALETQSPDGDFYSAITDTIQKIESDHSGPRASCT
ncbi:MAG TPA: PA2778 family cysteine peptidase [Gammaproteobacteria bacterium]|nr:PA2778 family cysteine peptidase [Gammaproteobacteria bacterium]